jgi:histidine triad (HIT) family protein
MKTAFQRLLRSRLANTLIPWLLAHMSILIPLHRLRETDTLMAFHHPQPSYPLHILIVPKRSLAGLQELTLADQEILFEIFQTVQSLVAEFNLEAAGYRVIVNGGKDQDIPLLHFHLISDSKS